MEIVTIKGVPVIEIYESFDGSYWFITEQSYRQDSVINGRVYKDDQILFGYAKLSACPDFAEFGYISRTELELLSPRVWKVPKRNWSVCPEVEVEYLAHGAKSKECGEKSSPLLDSRFQPFLVNNLKMKEKNPTIEKLSIEKLQQIARFVEKAMRDKTAEKSSDKFFGGRKRIIKF